MRDVTMILDVPAADRVDSCRLCHTGEPFSCPLALMPLKNRKTGKFSPFSHYSFPKSFPTETKIPYKRKNDPVFLTGRIPRKSMAAGTSGKYILLIKGLQNPIFLSDCNDLLKRIVEPIDLSKAEPDSTGFEKAPLRHSLRSKRYEKTNESSNKVFIWKPKWRNPGLWKKEKTL